MSHLSFLFLLSAIMCFSCQKKRKEKMAYPNEPTLVIMGMYHNNQFVPISNLTIAKDTIKIPGIKYCPSISFRKADSSYLLPGINNEWVNLKYDHQSNRWKMDPSENQYSSETESLYKGSFRVKYYAGYTFFRISSENTILLVFLQSALPEESLSLKSTYAKNYPELLESTEDQSKSILE